ncbi:hypothetical protein ACIPJS_14835 [Streptomyces sp. NPDC086783]|uniref:hypothetical protein n=1 Tax=Streptomyces sp. NPDC086783 TaxID=3365758 RepID=UPI0037F87F64
MVLVTGAGTSGFGPSVVAIRTPPSALLRVVQNRSHAAHHGCHGANPGRPAEFRPHHTHAATQDKYQDDKQHQNSHFPTLAIVPRSGDLPRETMTLGEVGRFQGAGAGSTEVHRLRLYLASGGITAR